MLLKSAILQPPVKDGSIPNDTRDELAKSKRKTLARRPKLLKRYTFQELSANTYAVNNLKYDMAGEVVLSPSTRGTFAFKRDSVGSSPYEPTEFNVNLASLT